MNLYDVYTLFDVNLTKGQGAMVYDERGVGYLDFYGGHAVISVGHSHPHYVKMIQDQLHRLSFYSNSVVNHLQRELADKLEKVSGSPGYELFLINSGAEANENALKLASFYNGRKKIIALNNSFHGRTSAAINITHTGQKHASPINQGVDVLYFDKDDTNGIVGNISNGDISAVIIEPIQGVGGLDMIKKETVQSIKNACEETNTILIMDEVQSGYGRSGAFFAFQHLETIPDIITMAKGMGNGFPIGGVLINSDKIPAQKGRLGTTYGGNHLACSAAIAVLNIIEGEGLIENAEKIGNMFSEELQQINGVKQVKGKGLMLGAEFDFPVKDLRKNLIFNQQVFTGSSSKPNILRLLPPLNITGHHVDKFLTSLKEEISKL